jgi:hypothetical protein
MPETNQWEGLPVDGLGTKTVGRLWAAYERDWIREAPRFRPVEALTADQELELCAHWSVGEGRGRAAEVAGKDPDAITAVPARE